MANAIYTSAITKLMTGDIDLLTDTLKFVLVDTALYTVNAATHDALNDIPESARVATSSALTGKSVTAGVFDASDVSFTGITGASVEAGVLCVDSGTESTSWLIAYIDTATGLPTATLTANNVAIVWDNTANKIFKVA